jgi:carbon-monoxide dehydrogenase small subunit
VRQDVELSVNGRPYELSVEPRKTLADALREDCDLTGTHLGCEHGMCGACTVVLDGEPVRSCLMFAVQCAGRKVTTVEGLGGPDDLHPLQAAFKRHHGLQCGFCTPGFLTLIAAVLERDPLISDEDLMQALASNICRCTGYQNIVAAVRDAAGEARRAALIDERRAQANRG